MDRDALWALFEWRRREGRKPLLIQGARQVGKTWLMREFGRRHFDRVAYVNFDHNPAMERLFSSDMDTARLVRGLEIETRTAIDPDRTLLIFDEIQECSGALASLKYFCEQLPRQALLAAGSLLGVAIKHGGLSFPVGKVDFLQLHPLTFEEFLGAMGEDALLRTIRDLDFPLLSTFRDRLIRWLGTYFFAGGMPEAVANFAEFRSFPRVRELQNNLLRAFQSDFAKHIPSASIPKAHLVWRSLPAQLAKGNRRFIYRDLHPGARAKEFEDALEWLQSCGLAHGVPRVSKPGLPLAAYRDGDAFKLFALDVGLLCAMAGLDERTLLEGNRIFEEFKGALAEQFVLQQLKTSPAFDFAHWASRTAEVDFLVQFGGQVIPIEVKATTNLQAKSLKFYCEKYNPPVALRCSLADHKASGQVIDVPLYLCGQVSKILRASL
ncbi:MAG: ATP-binding protein [Puniceicoccales bacterium]|jgi:predicted AAA+ superfamily ATPase|nr:ATP-binding protein [Puniceicoccales bacterium]